MSRWSYNEYPASAPRKAERGIKARSQRGAIGATWWSQRFVGILESFNMGARLTRGRSYARSGQVMDLVVGKGQVTAKVQGSRSAPYKVAIRLPAFTEAEWLAAEAAMAGQAIFLAQLLAGDMPQDIETAFRAAGLSLFPAGTRDLDTDCSCPDWANPCKHVAATYYILAETFDRDPWLIFQWRGRTREQLQERLGSFRQAEAPEAQDAATDAEPLGEAGFWARGEVPRPALAENARWDALLRQLGAAPIELGGRNFADILEEVLKTAALEAEALLRG